MGTYELSKSKFMRSPGIYQSLDLPQQNEAGHDFIALAPAIHEFFIPLIYALFTVAFLLPAETLCVTVPSANPIHE